MVNEFADKKSIALDSPSFSMWLLDLTLLLCARALQYCINNAIKRTYVF